MLSHPRLIITSLVVSMGTASLAARVYILNVAVHSFVKTFRTNFELINIIMFFILKTNIFEVERNK